MSTGNQVLPGAPETAEPMTTDASEYEQWDAPEPDAKLRRSAGGRWLVWMMRAVVWLVIVLIGYRGIAAIVTSYSGSGSSGATSARTVGQRFPVALAQAYALQFGQAYLTFSPGNAAHRAAELAGFLPPGSDPQLGWNGVGTQTLQSEQVAGVDVRSAHSAVVTLLARVNGTLVDVGIPIYASGGGMVVSGQPALLPAPRLIVPPAASAVGQDQAARQTLAPMLPGFFTAFAAGDTAALKTFAAPGTALYGLGGAVKFGGILQVSVPASSGATRQATVTVEWMPASGQPPPATSAQVDMTYAITVVRVSNHWYVQSIGASAGPQGPQS